MTDAPGGIDPGRARRAFARAAANCARASRVSDEIGSRLAEKLDYMRVAPARILDAGTGLGRGVELLRGRYRDARFIALDAALPMLAQGRRGRGWLQRSVEFARGVTAQLVCGDIAALPLKGASVDMIWSSLALPWANETLRVLQEFHRVLAPRGLLLFATYGPDTLAELKQAFAQAAAPGAHVHEFIDMHDVGDMLVASGFQAPVMEMEKLTVPYPDVDTLARDLRLSGQTCCASGQARGLLTPRAWRRMARAYEERRSGGTLPVTVEVVYGHCWRGEPRVAADGRHIVRLERGAGTGG